MHINLDYLISLLPKKPCYLLFRNKPPFFLGKKAMNQLVWTNGSVESEPMGVEGLDQWVWRVCTYVSGGSGPMGLERLDKLI